MATDYRVPWLSRGHGYTEDEVQAVVEVMRGTGPLTQGEYQTRFEKDFAQGYGLPNAFAVTSCASALELAAELSKVGPGDEVVVPAHTFAVSAIPFARRGAKIVWVDIDPKTFLMCPNDLAKKLTPRAKVIVAVHLYGAVCEMDAIMALARDRGVQVVEDVAQAIGARYKGRYAGSFGDFACWSFHSQKNFTTLGEGGMLSVRDPQLASLVDGFRHNGMRAFPEPREFYWKPCMTNVDFDWDGHWPFNYCMGEPQSALGSVLLRRLPEMIDRRRHRALAIKRELADFPEIQFQEEKVDVESVYHLLPARFDGRNMGFTRDQFLQQLVFEHKVRAIVQYYPLYRYPMFIRAGFGHAECPETDRFFDNMVSFPFHHDLTEQHMDLMTTAIRTTIETMRRAARSR